MSLGILSFLFGSLIGGALGLFVIVSRGSK